MSGALVAPRSCLLSGVRTCHTVKEHKGKAGVQEPARGDDVSKGTSTIQARKKRKPFPTRWSSDYRPLCQNPKRNGQWRMLSIR